MLIIVPKKRLKSEPLNLYVEDEKGNLMAGLVAGNFRKLVGNRIFVCQRGITGDKVVRNYCSKQKMKPKSKACRLLSTLTSFKHQILSKSWLYRKSYLARLSLAGQRYYYQKFVT